MYGSRTGSEWDAALLIVYLTMSMSGGWLLARAGFRLSIKDRPLVGAALGVVLATWLANVLSHWMQPPQSFWLAGAGTLAAGLIAWRRRPPGTRERIDASSILLILAVLGLSFVFFRMGRGLAILDDRKNLSLISLMAAGELPPRFYMNPDITFAYHYGFQLFGAAVMRIGGLFPWSAFDLAKGIAGGLAVGLAVIWGRRATGKLYAGVWMGLIVLFASGSRWLLLLLPQPIVAAASQDLTLWGSGAQTSSTLSAALGSAWALDGGPPVPLPFAFVNGILQPFILYLQSGPISMGLIVLFLILILYPTRLRTWTWAVLAVLLAFWALVAETAFVLFGAGLGAACLLLLARDRRLARRVWPLLACLGVASVLALTQGGTLAAFAQASLGESLAGQARSTAGGFALRVPLAIVSAHLGELRLDNLGESLIALMEIGPAILFAPLAAWFIPRAAKRRQAVAMGFALSTFLGFLLPIVVRYDVDRDITRMTQYALMGWMIMGVIPLGVVWRRGGPALKALLAGTTFALVLGGIVVTGPLMTAMPRAVFADGIAPADTAMTRQVWDELPTDALVMDSSPWRAVVVTGRLTRSSQDSSTLLESWETLRADPTVGRLVAAGFDYAYVDGFWLRSMQADGRESFQADCVQLVASVHDDGRNGDRWLYDLRSCPPG